MNTISRFAMLVFAIASLGACALDTDPTGDGYQGVEQVGVHGELTTVVELGDGTIDEVPGSLCACDSAECREQWVTDNYGCGFCIDTTCADGSFAGACVACDDPARPAPAPHTVFNNQTVR